MKIVIIEDEPKTASNLENTLKSIDKDFQILEIIDSVETGLQYFEESGYPDLVFSDIQIADGLSFEIFQKYSPTCPVIFCTAFDHYALQAFKTNGIDYLLKPFNETDVKKALEKYHKLKESSISNTTLHKLFDQLLRQKKQSILINYREKIIPVNITDIPFFYSINHQTIIYFEGKEQSINYSLDELEIELDKRQYFRANRQFIINRSFIKEVEHYFARKLLLKLTVICPENIVISKAKSTEFLKWLGE
ncbi:MAG: LytTR family DNA-binding domain-containing protein [Bacteroidetes bacterium]|nr:LytTR family DNA-binding domain-containing protein [Bacteroidota bacterium]